MRLNIPLADQLLNRLKIVFYLPKISGKSYHGLPVLAFQGTASINIRLSAPLRSGSLGLPKQYGSIRDHCYRKLPHICNQEQHTNNHNLAALKRPNSNPQQRLAYRQCVRVFYLLVSFL